MRPILVCLFCAILAFGSAQEIDGTITYNRKTDWISIMSKLPWATQEEIDRRKLTWGTHERKGQNYNLVFKGDKSVYVRKEEEEASTSYSWRQEALLVIRDYRKKRILDQREFVGKKFKIEDEISKTKWKIHNEIKEVAGYLCMKAETQDTIKGQKIYAWFTDAIPVSGGPEGFSGLPGMILELDINDGDGIITATKVDLETPIDKLPIPKKIKGKNISQAEFDEKLKRFIAESLEAEKNPFWRIRY